MSTFWYLGFRTIPKPTPSESWRSPTNVVLRLTNPRRNAAVTSIEPEWRGRLGSSCPIPVLALAGDAAAVTRVSRNVYWPRIRSHAIRRRALDSKPRARLRSKLIQVETCGGGRDVKTIRSRNRLSKIVSSTTNRDPKICCSIPASKLRERSGRRSRFPINVGSLAKFCKKLGSEIPVPALALSRVALVSKNDAANLGVAFV